MGSKDQLRPNNVDNQGSEEITVDSSNFNGGKGLASMIKDKLSMLSPDSFNYGTVCIYKVPEKHRTKNQEAYTPRLVSIGLLHHGESQLQAMEEYKLKYLNNFLHTFRVSLEKLVEYIHGQEKLVCGCYEDIYVHQLLKQSKTKPSEVILLDGVFVVELLLKNHFPEMREKGDIIFDNPWVSNDILHDLLLFENQLPLRFLYTLYNTFVSNNVRKCLDDEAIYPPSFNELTHKYFKNVGNTGKLSLIGDFRYARHLVEFLSILHMPDEQKWYDRIGHEKDVNKKLDFTRCPTASELKSAGVKFQEGKGKRQLDIFFDKEKGELIIPQLTVNDSTETFFRNLIAFEQSGYHSKFVTSYVILLDNLIDTHKDVDLLIQNRIIRNELGSSQQVADLFNNLFKEFVANPKEFYFVQQCRQLNEYSRDLWHKCKAKTAKWFAMLRRDYFGSPWSIISLIAGIILLVLTVIQTLCSVLQVEQGQKKN